MKFVWYMLAIVSGVDFQCFLALFLFVIWDKEDSVLVLLSVVTNIEYESVELEGSESDVNDKHA